MSTRDRGVMVDWWENFLRTALTEAYATMPPNSSSEERIQYIGEIVTNRIAETSATLEGDDLVFANERDATLFILRWT